ncbi:16818_t:CDS:2, partial [Funneliformis caledonium]
FAHVYPNSENFLVSECWFYGFLKRNGFSLQRKTKISQKLPTHLNDKLLEFQQFIIKKQKQFEYELCKIENMDETPVYFDMVGNLTIENHVLVDGTKLPLIVIFKGKQMPKNLLSGIIVLIHPKGWMDESGMKIWFDK